MTNGYRTLATLALIPMLSLAAAARADVEATVNHTIDDDAAFKFDAVPPPVGDDLATGAAFSLIDGRGEAGATLDALHDGKLPTSADEPRANFFFGMGTTGGRFKIDLGAAKSVGQINTYSWHAGARAPQVYRVYAADGADEGFNPSPKLFVDPAMAGWTLLASVDTRPKPGAAKGTATPGGRYGVSLNDDADAAIGAYRYLLFDVDRTENDDPYGNTFFSEIDVVDVAKVQMLRAATTRPADDKYAIVLDTTNLSDEMKTWAHDKLEPVCKTWYPKIVAMLPGDGFRAPRTVTIDFRTDMGGTPAYTNGNRVSCNVGWFEKNKDGEGRGAVVHELVHVVQHYKFGRKSVPFWLQEGIPDYIRWYLYEPESHGTRIRDVAKAKYDGAYRVSANFLDWATQAYDKDLVKKVNAIVRQGKYADALWPTLTKGKSLDQLDAEWKASLAKNPR